MLKPTGGNLSASCTPVSGVPLSRKPAGVNKKECTFVPFVLSLALLHVPRRDIEHSSLYAEFTDTILLFAKKPECYRIVAPPFKGDLCSREHKSHEFLKSRVGR
jgi:hypothetical protein